MVETVASVLSQSADTESPPVEQGIRAPTVAIRHGRIGPEGTGEPSWVTFCVSEPLPRIDLAYPIARHLLSPYLFKRYLLFARQHFGKLALVYRLGAVPSFVALVFVKDISVRTALTATVILCSASIITTGLFVSVDLLALLARNYEFWFLVVINALNWAIMAFIFNDIRALACVSTWFGLQTVIFMDANCRTYPNTILSMAVSTPVVLATAGLVAAELIADANYFTFQIQKQVVGNAADFIAFFTVTLVVFLVKILLLRKTQAKQTIGGMKTIPCVILRATLRLKPVVSNADPLPLPPFADRPHVPDLRRSKQRIVLASLPFDRIDVNRTLLPSRIWQHAALWTRKHADRLRVMLYATGGFALLLLLVDSIGSLIATLQTLSADGSLQEGEFPPFSSFDIPIAISSTVLTTIFCGTFVLFYQRDLARLLVFNFDFLFSALQTFIYAVCLCDMHYWDLHRSITVSTWFLWFLWVLSIDALTPSINSRFFRLRKRWTAPLLAGFICTVAAMGLTVLFLPGLRLQNRVIWHHKFSITDVEFVVQTQAVLLGRAFTICLWCSRQAFLRMTRRDDELVLIRGGLEYKTGLTTFPWRSKRRVPGLNDSSARNVSPSSIFPLPLALRRLSAGPVQPLGVHGSF